MKSKELKVELQKFCVICLNHIVLIVMDLCSNKNTTKRKIKRRTNL